MDLGLNKKVAVVAGGSRGCGRGISAALAAEGACVLLSGRRDDAVRSPVEAIRAAGGRFGRLLNIGSIAMKTPHLGAPMPATNTRVAVAALMTKSLF